MDKFLPFLYEKKEKTNNLNENFLYAEYVEYPTKNLLEKEEENKIEIMQII